MRHLTPVDYIRQPWKNGRGTTTELWRHAPQGALLVRLSRATVAEDGAFSLFPGMMRNLTVLTGPGFRLTGPGHDLRCDPLVPVAFPGDVALTATETNSQPSDDFNVMTAATLPVPEVWLAGAETLRAGGTLALYALRPSVIDGQPMAEGDLYLTDGPADITGDDPVLAIRLPIPLP